MFEQSNVFFCLISFLWQWLGCIPFLDVLVSEGHLQIYDEPPWCQNIALTCTKEHVSIRVPYAFSYCLIHQENFFILTCSCSATVLCIRPLFSHIYLRENY